MAILFIASAITRAYWNDAGGALYVSLHRPGHLDAVAIFRCEKIRTDEKQDDIGALAAPRPCG
jgi:hypothetical protein